MACTSAVQGASVSMHAGSMIVPEFDEVIKYHFPPPSDEFFDPYAKDGKERDMPSLFPRSSDRHDFHKAAGSVAGGAGRSYSPGAVLGNMAGLAKLATTSIAEILGNKHENAATAAAPALRETDSFSLTTNMLHCGTWHIETPEDIPNLEIPTMHYKSQWFGEEKMGGGWSAQNDPLTDEWRGAPVSERMHQLQKENPDKNLEELMVQEGELHKVVDEDGQQHVIPTKGAATQDEPMMRRTNPALI